MSGNHTFLFFFLWQAADAVLYTHPAPTQSRCPAISWKIKQMDARLFFYIYLLFIFHFCLLQVSCCCCCWITGPQSSSSTPGPHCGPSHYSLPLHLGKKKTQDYSIYPSYFPTSPAALSARNANGNAVWLCISASNNTMSNWGLKRVEKAPMTGKVVVGREAVAGERKKNCAAMHCHVTNASG